MSHTAARRRLRSPLRMALAMLLGLALLPALPAVRAADEFVERANKLLTLPPGNVAVETILFPAVAAMRDRPEALQNFRDASMVLPGDPEWSEAETWLMREPQRQAIDALAKLADTRVKYLMTIPYGSEGVDAEWVKAGLYCQLGPADLLAGARPLYLDALQRLAILATLESTRLAAAGDGAKSLTNMVAYLRLGRIICERPSYAEREAGARMIQDAGERLRDLVYTYPEAFTPEILAETVLDLDERLVEIRRITIPEFERVAAIQLVHRTMVERQGVNPGRFAATMSRLRSGDRPLTRFSEAATWRRIAENHAGWFDTLDQIDRVYGDWNKRYRLENIYDPLLALPSDYAKMNPVQYGLVEFITRPVQEMERWRVRLLTDMSGARAALAVVAFQKRNRTLPPNIFAVTPQFARNEHIIDYFHYDARYKRLEPLEYFVPIRDQPRGPRDLPKPHEVTVFLESQEAPVEGVAPSFAGSLGVADAETTGVVPTALPNLDTLPGLMAGDLTPPPADLFNPETGKLNVPSLKTYLLELLAKAEIDDEAVTEATAFFKEMATDGVKPETIADDIKARLTQETADDPQQMMAFTMIMGGEEGFTQLLDKVLEIVRAVGQTPAFATAFNAAQQDSLTQDQVRRMLNEAVEAAAKPELIDPVMDSLGVTLRGIIETAVDQLGRLSSFDVQLDDTNFIIYSVGPDGKANLARSAGPGGTDILYWPPVLSLTRQHERAGP